MWPHQVCIACEALYVTIDKEVSRAVRRMEIDRSTTLAILEPLPELPGWWKIAQIMAVDGLRWLLAADWIAKRSNVVATATHSLGTRAASPWGTGPSSVGGSSLGDPQMLARGQDRQGGRLALCARNDRTITRECFWLGCRTGLRR